MVDHTLKYVKSRNTSKGESNYCFIEGSTQITFGERTVPLNQTALHALRELQKINGQFPLVFANVTGKLVHP